MKWIMDIPDWDANRQLSKFNQDRWAVCDCGDADKHGKFVEGEPKGGNPETHRGIYWIKGTDT